MTYGVIWSDTARIQLSRLDKSLSSRIVAKVEAISGNPYLYVRRLTGVPLYSLRVGDYRVILDIKTRQVLVFVVKVGHRSNVYDRL